MIYGIAKRWLVRALASDIILRRVHEMLRRHGVIVLMYHDLRDDSEEIDAWTVVRRGEFLRQVEYLRRHYDLLTVDEAIVRVAARHPTSRPGVVITFDDGEQGLFDVLLRIVEAEQLPVSIYITTHQIEHQQCLWFDRVINAVQVATPLEIDLSRLCGIGRVRFSGISGPKAWREIDRLLEAMKLLSRDRCEDVANEIERQAAGAVRRTNTRLSPLRPENVTALANSRWIEIGSHSHCHGLFPQLTSAERMTSLQHNCALLRGLTGRGIRHFAYPSGRYDAESVRDVEKFGFATAMTTTGGIWTAETPVHLIPRIGIGRYDDARCVRVAAAGGVSIAGRLLFSALGAEHRCISV